MISLLEENYFDKNTLLLKNYQFLRLDENQLVFVLKLLKLEDNLKEDNIIKTLNISKKEYQEQIAALLKLKIIRIKKNIKEKKLEYSFAPLWDKIILILLPSIPTIDATNEKKYLWFISQLNIYANDNIKKIIFGWINEGGWKRMVSIVNLMEKLKDKDLGFKTIEKIYQAEAAKEVVKEKKIKSVIDLNWLK